MLLIDRNYFKYFLLFLPYLLSATVYTQTSSAFADVLLVGKLIAFVIIAYLYLRNGKASSFDLSVLVYCAWWFVSVIVNGGSVLEFVKEVVVILFYIFAIEEASYNQSDKYAIKTLSLIIVAELFINLVLLIIFPEGLWSTVSIYNDVARYNFLGLDNQTTPILLIATMLLGMDFIQNEYHITLYEICWGAIIIGNVILTQSGTAITALVVVTVVCLAATKLHNIFNIKIAIALVAIVFVGIVAFRIQNIFAFFIEGILGKDLSLTNRVTIWDRAIEMIRVKPILGYGSGTLETVVGDRNAHNFFLQIMLQSGIMGLLLYINTLRVALKGIFSNFSESIAIIIGSCMAGYLVCCISEVYAQGWLMILLSISYCSIVLVDVGGGIPKTSSGD